MLNNYKNLTNTEYERIALQDRVNFSDGHARQNLSIRQREIVNKSLDFIDLANTKSQQEIEADFLTSFFNCGSQNVRKSQFNPFLAYSSSCSIKIAAQFCRIRKLKVLLIEPCFDNIRLILQSEDVPIISIREKQLSDFEYLDKILDHNTAIWIVQPNNPTGFCLDEATFKLLIDKVSKQKATLIIDMTFRFFAKSLSNWDQYGYLTKSETSFISIEDTGKTWSLADNKVGITVCSKDNFSLIHKFHDELLLNVSPLQLLLLNEFIKDTILNGIHDTVYRDIEINRIFIKKLISKGLVESASNWTINVPMELLALPPEIPATKFWGVLREKGVDILPALNYYWTDPLEGTNLFRIPLSRPIEDFEYAIPMIESALLDVIENK